MRPLTAAAISRAQRVAAAVDHLTGPQAQALLILARGPAAAPELQGASPSFANHRAAVVLRSLVRRGMVGVTGGPGDGAVYRLAAPELARLHEFFAELRGAAEAQAQQRAGTDTKGDDHDDR